jgi:hypothetical protein
VYLSIYVLKKFEDFSVFSQLYFIIFFLLKVVVPSGHQWLMLVILTTWDADFGRITVRGQMGK